MFMKISIRPEFLTHVTYVSCKAHFFFFIFFIYKWPFLRLSAQLSLRSHTFIYLTRMATSKTLCPAQSQIHFQRRLSAQLSLHTHTFSHIPHIIHYVCVVHHSHNIYIKSYHIKWLADIGANIHNISQHILNQPFNDLTIYIYIFIILSYINMIIYSSFLSL